MCISCRLGDSRYSVAVTVTVTYPEGLDLLYPAVPGSSGTTRTSTLLTPMTTVSKSPFGRSRHLKGGWSPLSLGKDGSCDR